MTKERNGVAMRMYVFYAVISIAIAGCCPKSVKTPPTPTKACNCAEKLMRMDRACRAELSYRNFLDTCKENGAKTHHEYMRCVRKEVYKYLYVYTPIDRKPYMKREIADNIYHRMGVLMCRNMNSPGKFNRTAISRELTHLHKDLHSNWVKLKKYEKDISTLKRCTLRRSNYVWANWTNPSR